MSGRVVFRHAYPVAWGNERPDLWTASFCDHAESALALLESLLP